MSFSVDVRQGQEPTVIPCLLDFGAAGDTFYVGQIVKPGGDGVQPLGAASGAADTSNKSIPFGIIRGFNDKTPTHSATYQGPTLTSVSSQAAQAARDTRFNEGPMFPKSDRAAIAFVELIDPSTRIRGNIYNGAYGTAITTVTVTLGSATGLGYTADACDFTPVADFSSTICVSGANAGVYRPTTDTSTTVRTCAIAFERDIAIGDTFKSVPMVQGLSYIQFDAESTYIEGSATPATNYYAVIVEQIVIGSPQGDYAIFRFCTTHFDPARA